MARTIEQIYVEIINEKENFTSLDGLVPDNDSYSSLLSNINSNSKVAFWRLFIYIHSVAIYIHELFFDKHKVEIEALVASAPTGTPTWYQNKVLQFQYTDLLVYNTTIFQYVYPVIDPVKQIVTKCAVQDSPFGVVLIKVAKGAAGALTPLDLTEKAALESYVNDIKFAGTRISISSQDADLLSINYKIYYDPLTPLATIQSTLQTAVENYLNNTLPFNGKLNLNKLTDAMQAVPGVLDPVYVEVINTPFAGSSIMVDREILPAAGWFKLGAPLSTTCMFIPVP